MRYYIFFSLSFVVAAMLRCCCCCCGNEWKNDWRTLHIFSTQCRCCDIYSYPLHMNESNCFMFTQSQSLRCRLIYLRKSNLHISRTAFFSLSLFLSLPLFLFRQSLAGMVDVFCMFLQMSHNKKDIERQYCRNAYAEAEAGAEARRM